MNNEQKCAGFIFKVTGAVVFAVALLSASVNADAATLDHQFRNKDGDLICVYNSHFHEAYVNVGFNGHCKFNVNDDDLDN